MRPRQAWLWRRVRSGGSERGATLLFALLFITVISVVIAAVLSLAMTSENTTTQIRLQAQTAAAAEAGANIAINQLRRGQYQGAGDCFGLTGPLVVPTGTGSAAVHCTVDPADGLNPTYGALTSLQDNNGAEGLSVDINGSATGTNPTGTGVVTFQGDVRARRTVRVNDGVLNITGGTFSGDCNIATGSHPGAIVVGGTQVATNDPMCDRADFDETTVAPPPLTAQNGPPSNDSSWRGSWTFTETNIGGSSSNQSCSGTRGRRTDKITFTPGIYQYTGGGGNPFIDLFNCGSPDIIYDFRPGIYWFDFNFGGGGSGNANNIWTVNRGTLIAGSSTPLGSTVSFPISASQCDAATGGVTFVFGGQTQWQIRQQTGGSAPAAPKVQLCGRWSADPSTMPPVAIYGLTGDVSATSSAHPPVSYTVHRQSGCVVSNPGCATIAVDGNPSLYVGTGAPDAQSNGLTYLPDAWIDFNLGGNNITYDGTFGGGIIARRLVIDQGGDTNSSSRSITFAKPFAMSIRRPGVPTRTVVDLSVYVCPGATTCDAAGTVRLTAKVAITDSGSLTPGNRQIQILSWDTQPRA